MYSAWFPVQVGWRAGSPKTKSDQGLQKQEKKDKEMYLLSSYPGTEHGYSFLQVNFSTRTV